MDRRRFLIAASAVAGGLALQCTPLRAAAAMLGAAHQPWSPDEAPDDALSAWVEIHPDDTVVMRVPTPEIGNGAMTQVAMNLAEELGCDWSRIQVNFCSIQRNHLESGVYDRGFLPFFGGHGTDPVRMQAALQLGASARERLKAAAAARWKVPVAEVRAADSLLRHEPSGRSLRYGEVAAAAAGIALAAEPALKPPEAWTLLGKASLPKLNIPAITTGQATYGIDVRVPGMIYAALRQSPVQGGKLKSHDPDAVLGMPGVRAVVVVDPANTVGTALPAKATWGFGDNAVQSAVAVIADHYWQARQALEALPVEWDPGEGLQWADERQMEAAARALFDTTIGDTVLRSSGDVGAIRDGLEVSADYATPHCDNATLEPLNATACLREDGLEVWCPTQDLLQAYWVAIDESGLQPEQVQLHATYVGGGFGRRTQAEDVRMAVAVARAHPGVPVQLIWSREECFRQGRYRTPIQTRFKARLGADGLPETIQGKAVFIGTRPLFQINLGFDDPPYFGGEAIPNVDMRSSKLPVHVLNGAYRAPCFNSHVFAVESFIDECAIAAGQDPLEYRLKLLAHWDPAWSKCLRVAAEKSGWGTPLPKGEGRGIAISNWPQAARREAGTTLCTVARVAVSPDGKITVRQVDVAFDCGRVANPDAVRAQIEGGTIFGMNFTLLERLSIADGAIVEGNFDRYPMLRMGDDPDVIRVHFDALSGHERMDLIGEVPVGPIGPAIANAIYQATGKRLRSTPLREHDLRWS